MRSIDLALALVVLLVILGLFSAVLVKSMRRYADIELDLASALRTAVALGAGHAVVSAVIAAPLAVLFAQAWDVAPWEALTWAQRVAALPAFVGPVVVLTRMHELKREQAIRVLWPLFAFVALCASASTAAAVLGTG